MHQLAALSCIQVKLGLRATALCSPEWCTVVGSHAVVLGQDGRRQLVALTWEGPEAVAFVVASGAPW
jgi:hypothetical protein